MPARDLPAGAPGADRRRRARLGAFYTPAHTAAYMVGLLRDLGPAARVLEPSGGDGVFVDALLHTGLAPGQVDVWDCDPATETPIVARGAAFTLRDSLLDAPDLCVFTHAVGNPPYLNKASAYVREHRDALRARYGSVGVNDTYALFLVMALRQLAPGGQLVMLVSNTFLTLGIYRRLREALLQVTVDAVTLLPEALFPDAAVRTCVLAVTNAQPPPGHRVTFTDMRGEPVGVYSGGVHRAVPQAEVAGNPGAVFAFADDARRALAVTAACPTTLLSLCDGGLGMWTCDNEKFLRVVDHANLGTLAPVPAGQAPLPAAAVDGTAWRAYHKRGGDARWWRPAEHAIAWTPDAVACYSLPVTGQAGTGADGRARPGVILSGVSTRMAARLATPGAMWESNKCFGLFPRDPDRHPPQLLLAVLNSAFYGQVAAALNHTVSLQSRDVAALPWLPFTDAELTELIALGNAAVCEVRAAPALTYGEVSVQAHIDAIVERAASRALAGR